MSSPLARRPKRLAALGTCLGLSAALGFAAPGLTTAAQAAPAQDCKAPFPVADVAVGDEVTGLTVTHGTTPEGFTGEVLGVLKNGINAGRDMIMMKLDSPAIDDAGGIWQGMSGSPVYAEDGRLIGAVAYGLANGPSAIAGITPFEYMQGYLGPAAPARHVTVGAKAAKRIAATGEATARQAARGFTALPTVQVISGVDPDRLTGRTNKTYLRDVRLAGGAASAADAASIDTVEAGGNLAAAASVGDVTGASIGTVTSVCDGKVVGFGHPMNFAGKITYGLAAADALYIQEDSLGQPFKVANVGEVGGTIDQDRLTGISGTLGAAPPSTTFTSNVTFGASQRSGVTSVYDPMSLATVSYYGNMQNHITVMDQFGPGSETQTWRIEGTDETGAPFTIDYDDLFWSKWDLSDDGGYPLGDTLWAITQSEGAKVASVTNTVVASTDVSRFKVKKIEQRAEGAWMKLNDGKAVVEGGSTLKIRVTLKSATETKTVMLSQAIPKKWSGNKGWVQVVGGGSNQPNTYSADSVAEVIDALEGDAPNDTVQLAGSIGKRKNGFAPDAVSTPIGTFITGGAGFKLVVK